MTAGSVGTVGGRHDEQCQQIHDQQNRAEMSMVLRILTLIVCIVAIYPTAVVVQIGLDWFRGDAEFMRLLLFDSRRRLLLQLLSDWKAAAPLCAAAFGGALIFYHGARLTGLLMPFLPWLVLGGSLLVLVLLGVAQMIVLVYAAACLWFAIRYSVLAIGQRNSAAS